MSATMTDADTIAALRSKCAVLSASLKQAEDKGCKANPLISDCEEDTMNCVHDVLLFLSVAVVGLGDTGLSPTVASGMSHVLNCCCSALKGGAA